jgi:hypothetical protein
MRTKRADPTLRPLINRPAEHRLPPEDALEQPAPGLPGPAHAPALEHQAARLGHRESSPAQRQRLATQLGQLLGNATLQRVIARASLLPDMANSRAAAESGTGSREVQPPAEKGPRQRALPPAGGAVIQRWDAPAHLALGNRLGPRVGYLKLTAHDRDLPLHSEDPGTWPREWRTRYERGSAIQKRMLTQGLSYGEMLAMGGDFYPTFRELDNAPLHELYRLVDMVNRPREPSTAEFQEVTGGRYLDLAKKNAAHFRMSVGTNSLTSYIAMHQQALEEASAGNARRAYAMNAVADHFLTDSFAGAHLRVARSEMTGTIGSIRSKVEHDLDGRFGVEVSNPRGDRWIAYGETLGDLRDERNRRSVEILAEAMALSAKDIEDVLHMGPMCVMPEAVNLVPKPVDPTRRRWGPDDYQTRLTELAGEEAPGVLGEVVSDDNQVREWIGRTPGAALAVQPVDQKVRMIKTLLSGWISDDDVEAVEKLGAAIPEGEQATIWSQVEEDTKGMTSPRQWLRVVKALRPGGSPSLSRPAEPHEAHGPYGVPKIGSAI